MHEQRAEASLVLRRRLTWRRSLGLLAGLGMIGFNGVAALQARALLTYMPAVPQQPGEVALEQRSPGERLQTIVLGAQVPRPENHQTPAALGLAYEIEHIAAGEQAQLEIWVIPQQTPRGIVVLFHGYAASKESLIASAATFVQAGYTAVLVDFQGSGGSTGSATTLGINEAHDVSRALAYAQERWPGQPVILYGFSMGAAAILRAVAVDGIQPSALILEAPFDRLLNTVRNRFAAMSLPAFPAAELLMAWGGVQQGFNPFSHNPVEYAAAVQCPVLLVHGEDDPRVTVEENAALARHLPATTTEITIAGLGHNLASVASPERWSQEVSAFLAMLP